MSAALPEIRLPGAQVEERTPTRLRYRFDGHGPVTVERCTAGRLRDAYPVGEHDVEVTADAAVLPDVVHAVTAADPHCRRIVVAVCAGDLGAVAAAEAAGFRFVVDVDLPGASLSLLVAEPGWVTRIDHDTDAITDRRS